MYLKIENLNTFYGNLHAIWDISIDVDQGEIVTLIGSNGAGKSTLLKSIAGSIKTRSGSIKFNGEEIRGHHANKIVKTGIILCPEGRQIFPKMTVWENLRMGGFLRNKGDLDASYERVYDLFPILKERRTQAGGTLSGGEQQMLAIGRSLMSNPKILMLDEPSLGLSPVLTERVFDLIKQIRDQGVTILLVEQNAVMALQIADRGYLLNTGHLGKAGTGQDLLNSPEILETYLG